MKRTLTLVAVAGLALAACTQDATPEQREHEFACAAGTVSGAVFGGVVGSFIGGGTGRVVATGAGAALGGLAGNRIACG
jgi:uncharacterized protein YcfJ